MRNNRRINELFIGKEFLTEEGRTVKHPALIQYYANLNINKTSDSLIDLIGIDIETNHLTGEMKLLGFYYGDQEDYLGRYAYYTEDHLSNFISHIKYAISNGFNFAFWNSLDAFQIFRLFLLHDYTEERESQFMKRFGKVSGEFNNGEWIVDPVIEIDTGSFKIGIKQVIRTSIQFYIQYEGDTRIKTCWGYNIASLYTKPLLDSCLGKKDKETGLYLKPRLPFYSKVDESAHIVDWDRFNSDEYYKNEIVLKSNELDARAGLALGYEIQKDFYEAFGCYPVSLISQGSHARSAVTAQIENDLKEQGFSEEEVVNKKFEEISSIPLITHIDNWLSKYPEELVKDLYLMTMESYSGGYIEAIRYGYSKSGWYADLAGAYTKEIQDLYDLRGSEIESGIGEPPIIKNSYIFIRGKVTIPDNVNYHSITIKHPIHKDTNIRPVGTFIASYMKDERDFLIQQGAIFQDEKWIAVITKGKKSVLSNVSVKLGKIRDYLISIGSYAEEAVKRENNSLYGILYEAVAMYEDIDGEPIRSGYRGGEFLNSLYATVITSRTRLKIADACYQISKRGGEPILIMTDSITWKGRKTDLPEILNLSFGESGIKIKKTTGYFEDPEEVKDIVCLGSGRYGFKQLQSDGSFKYTNKRRGLNAIDFENPDGIILDHGFTWENVLKLMKQSGRSKLKVTVRALISVGVVLHRLEYNSFDLGRIVEEVRDIDIIVGKNKRSYNPDIEDPELLSTSLVMTDPIYLDYNTFKHYDYVDGSYPILRGQSYGLILKSRKQRKQNNNRKRQKKFYNKNKAKILEDRKLKYKYLIELGFISEEAKVYSGWSISNLKKEAEERGKQWNLIIE